MTALVVGGSAGLGRALAGRLAAAGHDLVLVSSDERDLAAMTSDLKLRHGVRVSSVAADLGGDCGYLEELEDRAAALGGLDHLLFPAGAVADQDDPGLDPAGASRLLAINFLAVAAIVARFLPELKRWPRAAIVGFGTVAAARGRSRNLVYAASKRALQTYFEGLRHACAQTPVTVQFYVLGYLDTNLAFGRPTPLPRADPGRLSARILRDLRRDVGVVYYPAAWRVLCGVLRCLPWFLYSRLRF